MADDEDFFSDDDFDDIPINALDQLEQKAVLLSTQRQQQPEPPPAPLRKQAHNASSLNRGGSLNKNLPWRPPQPSRSLINQQPRLVESVPPPSAPEEPSSDYGVDDDEDVIDMDEPSMVIQPVSRSQSAMRSFTGNRARTKPPLDPDTEAAFAAADAELGSQTFARREHVQAAQQAQNSLGGGSMDVSALQRRIAELEAQQARLQKSEEEARNEARAKQGEIAIVRSNQEKLTRQYEARISVMQRLHADEAAKVKTELETQRKEREKMETDNRFLQHDLAQEAERAKRVNVQSRTRTANAASQRKTPQKPKRPVLGDGFDDNEVHIVSPSKSKEKTREGTPKLGAKRKRPANDSPAAALSFNQPSQPIRHESSERITTSFEQPSAAEIVPLHKDYNYECMQLILNRKPYEGHERTVEMLTKYSFPSKPETSLSSILIDQITRSKAEDVSLAIHVSQILLGMWEQCLDEPYFEAFYLILDMLRFILHSELSSVKARLVERAVPLCSKCIEMVPVALRKASSNRTYAANLDRKALDKLAEDLEEDEIVGFLSDLCGSASLSAERCEAFWSAMDIHTVLVLLSKTSPMEHIMSTLNMLTLSVRPLTFGVIHQDAAQQSDVERSIIDRLTNLLFQVPEPPKDEPAYTDEEILELRLQVLHVLREICRTDHGTLQLVHQRSTIGRLVRFLDTQVSGLYRARPATGLNNVPLMPHDLIAKAVNQSVRILYHLLKMFDDPPAINQKLRVMTGGYHKFVVSLTRIAFSEQLVFEAGIDDEVCEAAHVILDNFLAPEDGDSVMQAFETPRGTRASLSQRNDRTGDAQQREDTNMSEIG